MGRVSCWSCGFSSCLFVLGSAAGTVAVEARAEDEAPPPLRVLIYSGLNNHDWASTTPVIKKMFEDCPRFGTVDVTEDPGRLDPATFARYDVIVSNWTPYPNVERIWTPETEQAFLDFVRNGGGFVVIHAAACTFQVWPEFQQLIALTWKADYTAHGTYHTFKVSVEDANHPIARGLSDFCTTDELYHNMVQMFDQPLNVVFKAFSAKEEAGTGKYEPALVWTQMGKGRGVNLVLGHDAPAMGPGFATLLLRGAEWAATGEVTIPPPAPDATAQPPEYAWERADVSLALRNRGRVVWQCNYGPDLSKPHFHPVALTDGTVLTMPSPADHPWHKALWFSWKMLNRVNYWEEDAATGKAQGLTELTAVNVDPHPDRSARIEMDLSYHPPGAPPVLTESRLIEVSAPDDKGVYRIDWQGVFTAGDQDVLLEGGTAGGGYAGLSVRISQQSDNWALTDSEGRRDVPGDGDLAANTHGKRARWMDFSLTDNATNATGGIAILDHPSNPRHPSEWHNIMSAKTRFGYFSPAMLWSHPYTLSAGQNLTLRYRILVHPGRPAPAAIESEWKTFAS